MFTRNHIKMWLLALVVGAVLLSCRKDFDSISTSQWQPELASPFVQSNITMRNIVGSDTNLYTDPDSLLIYLYHRDSVFQMTADSVLQPPDNIIYEDKYTLGAISINEELFNEPFTLDEMLNYVDQAIADSIRKYDGTYHIFPPFEQTDTAQQIFNPSADYEYLTFSDGYLVVNVTNTMPVTFNNIKIIIEDLDFSQLLKEFDIAILAPGETYTDSISLKNITVGNEFAIDINYFSTSGSFPNEVLIDLQQGFEFNLTIHGGLVIAGKAKIDEQILVTESKMIDYNASEDEKLFHVKLRNGTLDYHFESGLAMDAGIEIKFPSALIDGEIPENQFELNTGEIVSESTDIQGLSIDFTTDPEQPYNRFPVDFTITLPATDEMVSFDSSDFIVALFDFKEIKLAYADGYFGKREINVSRDTLNTNLDFLNHMDGEIILTEPEFKLVYINEIGVPFKFLPEYIGINTVTGDVQNLNADSLTVNAPEQSGETVNGEIKYDNTNSSIVDFLAIRPNIIVYDGGGITNSDNVEFNFIYDTAIFTGNAEVKVPLILKSSFLGFTDTVKISPDKITDQLKEGFLIANVINGFPLDLNFDLIIPDSVTGELLEKVRFGPILSAIVGEDGKVIEPTIGQVTGVFDEDFMQSLERANIAYVYTSSRTFDEGEVPVGLYSDYLLQIAIGYQAVINP